MPTLSPITNLPLSFFIEPNESMIEKSRIVKLFPKINPSLPMVLIFTFWPIVIYLPNFIFSKPISFDLHPKKNNLGLLILKDKKINPLNKLKNLEINILKMSKLEKLPISILSFLTFVIK